ILVVIFVAMSILHAQGAEAPGLIERPAAESGPTEVSVGIWVVDISKIDSAEQSFTADIAMVLRWKDTRLAHLGTGLAHYALDQIGARAWVWRMKQVQLFASCRSLLRLSPTELFSIGSVTPELSRSHCDCNRSRSIGKLFACSWSRSAIGPTK